jgi:hypothetical protein
MDILPIGLTTFEVSAQPGSYVGISKDGVLHGAALVGASGTAEVPIEPILASGMVDIVVTGQQLVPYITQIQSAALQGAYVVLDDFTISDPSGNNNGLADYGEEIMLNVSLKNVGNDPSGQVSASVNGSDQYVTFTGPATQNFGVIPADGTVAFENAFGFAVADFVPDQHQATFELDITDGNGAWTSNLQITISAPVISISDEFLVDDSQSGNNNGILDPGETALLKLDIQNTGHSNISEVDLTISSGDPLLVINTPVVTIASFPAGSTYEVAISVTADPAAPLGHPVNIDLQAEAGPDSVYTAEQMIELIIGIVPEYLMTDGTFTVTGGNFYDSGGPDNYYQNYEDYTMTFIPALPGQSIVMEFLMFEIESHSSCNYDWLKIYDGTGVSSPLIGTYCGTNSPGTVQATNAEGALTFQFHSDYSVTRPGWEAVFELQGDVSTQTILIPAGWSGISSCFIPEHPGLEVLLQPIMDELIILQSMDGMFFPEMGINTIGNWNPLHGYKIKSEAPVTLEITGWHNPQQSVQLDAGWSMIPIMGECEVGPEVLFDAVENNTMLLKEVAGTGIYWPGMGINTIGNLQPGKAYLVWITNPVTISFPDCD